MESELALDMLVSGTTEKARISTIIMDEDSTKMAKIKKTVTCQQATKKSAINRARKTVGSDLYALQKKHHILSAKVIY